MSKFKIKNWPNSRTISPMKTSHNKTLILPRSLVMKQLSLASQILSKISPRTKTCPAMIMNWLKNPMTTPNSQLISPNSTSHLKMSLPSTKLITMVSQTKKLSSKSFTTSLTVIKISQMNLLRSKPIEEEAKEIREEEE